MTTRSAKFVRGFDSKQSLFFKRMKILRFWRKAAGLGVRIQAILPPSTIHRNMVLHPSTIYRNMDVFSATALRDLL